MSETRGVKSVLSRRNESTAVTRSCAASVFRTYPQAPAIPAVQVEKFNALNLPKIPGDDVLHSRARDLYQALLLPLGEYPEACGELVKVFQTQQKSNREPLSACQAAVLEALFIGIHKLSENGTMAVSELTSGVNSQLRAAGEGFRISPRKVGAALTSLGLSDRQRTNTGWYLLLDRKAQKQIHELIAAYGVDSKSGQIAAESKKGCDFCKGSRKPEIKVEHTVSPNGMSTYTYTYG
jgi:hypothetical protein